MTTYAPIAELKNFRVTNFYSKFLTLPPHPQLPREAVVSLSMYLGGTRPCRDLGSGLSEVIEVPDIESLTAVSPSFAQWILFDVLRGSVFLGDSDSILSRRLAFLQHRRESFSSTDPTIHAPSSAASCELIQEFSGLLILGAQTSVPHPVRAFLAQSNAIHPDSPTLLDLIRICSLQLPDGPRLRRPSFTLRALTLQLTNLTSPDCRELFRTLALLGAPDLSIEIDNAALLPSPQSFLEMTTGGGAGSLDFSGLAGLPSLRFLRLALRGLQHIGQLTFPTSLERLDLSLATLHVDTKGFGDALSALTRLQHLALRDPHPYCFEDIPSMLPAQLTSLALVLRTESAEFSRRSGWQRFLDLLVWYTPDLARLKLVSDHLDISNLSFAKLGSLRSLTLLLRVLSPMHLPPGLQDLEVTVTGSLVAGFPETGAAVKCFPSRSSSHLSASPASPSQRLLRSSSSGGSDASTTPRSPATAALAASHRSVFPKGLPLHLRSFTFHNLCPERNLHATATADGAALSFEPYCSCNSRGFHRLLLPLQYLRSFEYVGCLAHGPGHVWHKIAASLPKLEVLEVFSASASGDLGSDAQLQAAGADPALDIERVDTLERLRQRSNLLYSFYRRTNLVRLPPSSSRASSRAPLSSSSSAAFLGSSMHIGLGLGRTTGMSSDYLYSSAPSDVSICFFCIPHDMVTY